MPMTAQDVIDHTRLHVLRDVRSPPLFDEETLLAFLNEGYSNFARFTHAIIDHSATITTVAGTARYDLPAETLHVRGVSAPTYHLCPYTRRARPRTLQGRPVAYTTDGSRTTIQFYPIPDDVYTLTLERAVDAPTLGFDGTLALPDVWALLHAQWIAYRALQNNDADGSKMIPGMPFFQNWSRGIVEAKRELARLRMGDSPSAQPRSWT